MTAPKPLILVIEDEEDMLLGLQHNLEYEGYRTLAATDGRDGLAKALTGTADLVILDVMLPELNGFDVLHEMRQRKVVRSNFGDFCADPTMDIILVAIIQNIGME